LYLQTHKSTVSGKQATKGKAKSVHLILVVSSMGDVVSILVE